MPSQKDLLREIETHATTLAEAVAAAEVYYEQYVEEIENTLQEQLAANQAEYDQTVERIQQEHDQAVEAVLQQLHEVEEACGLWAAAWDDPAWDDFEPDPEAPVPDITRLGRLTVSADRLTKGTTETLDDIARRAAALAPVEPAVSEKKRG
jgi:hypothetical protein